MTTFQIVVCVCAFIVLCLFGKAMRTRLQYRAGHLSPSPGPVATPPAGTAPTATAQSWVPLRVRSHPWWTAITILLCLALLPEIVAVGKSIATKVWEGPDNVFRGTPRSEWGIGVRSEPAAPVVLQGKSVGGPLRWSDNAKVEIRKRFTTETFNESIAFVGMIPPGSWMDLRVNQQETQRNDWNAFLVSKNELGFIPTANLQNLAKGEHYQEGIVLPLKGLNGPKMEFSARISSSKANIQDGYKLEECYVQATPSGPKGIRLDQQEPSGTFQYEVKVGANTTSLTIPHQNWKWLWIAAVHHPKYQSVLDGQAVPAKGISIAGHQNLFGTMAKVNGETKVLETPLLFQAGDVTSSTIDLYLNVPKDAVGKIGTLEPATIIVGVL